MILLFLYNGRVESIVAPAAVGGYPLSPSNFEVALGIMLRSNLSNVRYAHWMDDRAAIAGRSYLNIFGVVTGTGLKVASFTNAPGDDNVSCKLNRLAAFQVAGITPDDVANVMDNPADAQEYRDLLA